MSASLLSLDCDALGAVVGNLDTNSVLMLLHTAHHTRHALALDDNTVRFMQALRQPRAAHIPAALDQVSQLMQVAALSVVPYPAGEDPLAMLTVDHLVPLAVRVLHHRHLPLGEEHHLRLANLMQMLGAHLGADDVQPERVAQLLCTLTMAEDEHRFGSVRFITSEFNWRYLAYTERVLLGFANSQTDAVTLLELLSCLECEEDKAEPQCCWPLYLLTLTHVHRLFDTGLRVLPSGWHDPEGLTSYLTCVLRSDVAEAAMEFW
jgi:hypothetical protein